MNQGKFVIIAMVAIGVALAGFGWWVRYSRSQQVLAIWGPQAVIAIRTGDRAELIPLGLPNAGPSSGGPTGGETDARIANLIAIESENYLQQTVVVRKPIDITKAPGLIHARHHLVHEKGFNWEAPREEGCVPHWEIAIRFTDKDNVATIVFDFECNRAYLVERKKEVGMRPIIADALQKFLADFELGTVGNVTAASGPSTAPASTQ